MAAWVLYILLSVYAAGTFWVLGLLYVTLMKFAGVVAWSRPAWLFGTVQRSMFAVLVSAAALIAFDMTMRAAGVI